MNTLSEFLESEPVRVVLEVSPLGEIQANGKPLEPGLAALLIRLLQAHYFPLEGSRRPRP